MLGIWGVGGCGKTTLASSIYDEICRQFDGCYFIQNIREEASRYGLRKLEEDILSKMGVDRVGGGRRMIKDRLCHRKVLIVFDDVDNLEQLKALAGSHDWFGEGSLIIITTRDEHLLNIQKVDVIHEITLLNNNEGMELFCKHAPRGDRRVEDYEVLTNDVVSYAGGLPLALRVLGCFLCHKDMNQWRSAIVRLKEIPDTNILGKLEDLDKIEAIKIDFWFQPESEEEQDLPWFSSNMKNLRYMESIRDPAKSLFNDLPLRELCCLILSHGSQKQLWEGCKLLPSLKLLKLYSLKKLIMTPDFNGLPNLERFILKACGCLKEIDPSIGCFEDLVFFSVEGCPSLEMFPPIWGIKKLESFSFPEHPKLVKFAKIHRQKMDNSPLLDLDNSGNEVASYIESCQNLFFVICWRCGCSNLPGVECCVEEPFLCWLGIFHNLQELRFLRNLDLRECNLGDEDIGSDVLEFPNLQQLNLRGNKFSRLSFNCLRLPRLKWLDVSYCFDLVQLSDLPSSIVVVKAVHCMSLERFGDISNCKWLWKVLLQGKNKVGPLVGEILLDSMFQGNAIEDHFISFSIPRQIPKGFAGRSFRGKRFTKRLPHVKYDADSFRLRLPDDWCNDFSGFLIRVVTLFGHLKIDVIMKE
ncbi:unnamed protein product [Lactuca virosa]|uniref:NB-ARC domain-containing protein n=1 Tax=Lactuca virosa TaxID=75947 RepID=A0AAU9MJG3_9ASTR|nr:unnamed protein product [Lactuca virosa]